MFCHLRSLKLPAAAGIIFTAVGGDADCRWMAARKADAGLAGPARRHRKNAASSATAARCEARVYFWATKHTLQGGPTGFNTGNGSICYAV